MGPLAASILWFICFIIIVVAIPSLGANYSSTANENPTESWKLFWRFFRVAWNFQQFEIINLIMGLIFLVCTFLYTYFNRSTTGLWLGLWHGFVIFITLWLIWSALSFCLWNQMTSIFGEDFFKQNERYKFGDEGNGGIDLKLVVRDALTDEVYMYFVPILVFTVCLLIAMIFLIKSSSNESNSSSNESNSSSNKSNSSSNASNTSSNESNAGGQKGGRRRRRR